MRAGYIVFCLVLLASLTIHCRAVSAKVVPSPCKIKHPSDDKVESECRRLKKGETLEGLFGDRWPDVARFNRIDRRHIYPGLGIKVPKRLEAIVDFTPMPGYYQPAGRDAKYILVDLSEQFLGAYEYGRLAFSAPLTTGEGKNDKDTPTGIFRISAYDSRHVSSLYFIENTDKLYPMHYGLLFHTNKAGVAFWIHGRDVPGYPGSHGCIGLYDEDMQYQYYGYPKKPLLRDAAALFRWVTSSGSDDGRYHILRDGPKVEIIGRLPLTGGKTK